MAISPWADTTVIASLADHFDVPASICWWAFCRWTMCWLLSTWNTSLNEKKILFTNYITLDVHGKKVVQCPTCRKDMFVFVGSTYLIISNDFSLTCCRSRMRFLIALVTASCLKSSPSLAAFSAAPETRKYHKLDIAWLTRQRLISLDGHVKILFYPIATLYDIKEPQTRMIKI